MTRGGFKHMAGRWLMTSAFPILSMLGCAEVARNSTEKNDLSKLETVPIEIVGRTTYTSYVARQEAENGRVVQLGLMNTTEDELPEDHGMIFVFPYDDLRSFWMRNTIIPLDIAYLDAEGVVLNTYTMAPLDERFNQYPSAGAAQYAIEVNANVWSAIGLQAGDRLTIPTSVLKKAP